MKGFKDFILKGNLIELAVAFIMGTAFAAVVKAFATILLDLVGLIFQVPDFSGFKPGGVSVGIFITALITFLITSFALYIGVVAPYNKYKQIRGIEEEEDATEASLLTEIRDLLAGK